MPSSSPKPIGHTTVHHVDEPDVINSPEPARALVPLLTNDLNDEIGASDSDNDSLPFLGDPDLNSSAK